MKQYYLEMCPLLAVFPAICSSHHFAGHMDCRQWQPSTVERRFHHDLNTHSCYWPCYTGNHLQEAVSYTDWLLATSAENKKYTKTIFGVNGLAVPGVTTISGNGSGWMDTIFFVPSVSSWLAQHFYWQWKYSMDKSFRSKGLSLPARCGKLY